MGEQNIEFFKKYKMRYNSWYYKVYRFIRWDFWNFFKNVWKFKKQLLKYREHDAYYSLQIFQRSLEILLDDMKKYNYHETKNLKIQKLERTIELLNWHTKDLFIELAEKELGIEVKFEKSSLKITDDERKVFNKSIELEKETWTELMKIIKGQDLETLKLMGFDGSGLKSWWY